MQTSKVRYQAQDIGLRSTHPPTEPSKLETVPNRLKRLLRKFPVLWQAAHAVNDTRLYAQSMIKGSFSQHGEDLSIMNLLIAKGARGPYVDIGCNHPFRLSNTYLLYLNGWRGLCVDPLPRFRKLYQRWRPEDQFESAAINDTPGAVTLYEFGWDALSTLSPEVAASYIKEGIELVGEVKVEAFPLNLLLERNNISAPICLLSIDIEGRELSALQSIDLSKWEPLYVCLEVTTADGTKDIGATQYLLNRGYTQSLSVGCNILFERQH